LNIKISSPSAFLVQWTDPNVDSSNFNRIETSSYSSSRRRFYTLEYWNFEVLKNEAHKKLTTDNTKLTLNQLEPDQQYAIRVKVVLQGGQESEWSETTYVRTPKDG
jgi:hypothetical protein